MKKSGYILAIVMLLFNACSIEDPNPMELVDVQYGAILRTVKVESGAFNFFNLPGSSFIVELEEDDPQRGKMLGSVDVYVRHRRGATLSNEVKLRTIPASAFAVNETSKLPRTKVTVTAPEAMTALAKTAAQVSAGDIFEVRFELLLTDGRKFTTANASEPIRGTAFFASPFTYRATVVCPSELAGQHDYSTTNTTPSCDAPATGKVTFTPVAGVPGAYTLSDASFGLFDCAYSDGVTGGTVRLSDGCGKLSFSGTDKYGDGYAISNVAVAGNKLTFDWENTYGDAGTTTLTRAGGANWPTNLK